MMRPTQKISELDSLDIARNPYRTIVHLAWPQLLMMVFHFFIGFVDVWVAGRIDPNVQAALGVITQSLFLFLVVAMAVANGSVAAISQSMGAGLYKRIQRYVGLCLILSVAFGLLLLVAVLPLRGLVLDLLRIPAPMREVTEYFLTVFVCLLPPYYLLIVCNAIFRAQKRVMVPLYAMIIVTGLNTVGDLGLGLGWFGMPNLGARGVAWATFGSVTAGAAFSLFMLRRLRLLKRESFAPWRWVRCALPYLVKVAVPSGIWQGVWHLGYMVLYAITASLPEGSITALAGMAAGIRIESILFLPAFAFNLTASILVGHMLGAGRPAEAKRFGWRILSISLCLVGLIGLCLWAFIRPIAGFLAPDPLVQAECVNYLFWNILAIPFTLASMVLAGVFNGAGATLYNLLVMGVATWAVRLPLAWWLGHEVFASATGIWISMLCSQGVQALAMLYFFGFRNWQRFSMIKNRNHQGANAA